ncbi:MAG: ABC transporter permease [Acidimicrobiia bacterium]|nr:ABC transporter permease [Acidimicrobiia bacterium]
MSDARQESSEARLQETSNLWTRLRNGRDFGVLPVIFGLVIIAIGFQTQNENFLTPGNLVNLTVQMSAVTIIAMGVVYVLLLGEIDLSVGYVSGVGGAILAVLLLPGGPAEFGPATAIVLAILAGVAIGTLQGTIITKLAVPSFVVTLAGLLGWSGVVLIVVGSHGSIIIQDDFVRGLANSFLPEPVAWVMFGGLVFAYTYGSGRRIRQRSEAMPDSSSTWWRVVPRVGTVVVLGGGYVAIAYQDRGVPYVAVLLIALALVATYSLTRTRFGIYVYAIGGNVEAAKRAGVNTDRIRIACFAIASMLAVIGGIVFASRLRSVDASAGSGPILLYAIAAPVIGGTSLFGGRGSIFSAFLGALVIATIDNGLGLLGLSSGVKFIVTGLVLLLAVIADSLSRRSRAAAGERDH